MEDDAYVHLPLYFERPPRPRIRADCLEGGVNEFRPCPWTGCRHNIVESTGNAPTCALDVAEDGGVTLEEVGAMMGVTRERIRQIEASALKKIRRRDIIYTRNLLKNLLEE